MAQEQSGTSKRGRTLGYLTAFMATSHVDRHIIAIALPAIGLEFALDDIQLGVLSGIAFSLVFALGAIPLGMVTAFIDRRHVIALSILAWSVMTALSGLAAGFWFLLLARIGVGLAESAGVPAAHRVVSETQEQETRIRAFAVFNAGANIGIALALIGGGILVQTYGWRTAMVVAGLPGIALAGLTYLCIDGDRAVPRAAPRTARGLTRAAAGVVFASAPKRLTAIAVALTSIVTFGMLAWLPSFLIRAHGLTPQQAGVFLAVSVGIGGTLGTVVGGRIVERAARARPEMALWLPMLALLACKPLIVAAMVVPSAPLAMALLVPPMMVGTLHFVSALVVMHRGLDGETRLMASAFLLTAANLTGYTVGPLVVGVASWAMSDSVPGGERLGYAIILLQALSAFGLYVYWRAGVAYGEAVRAGSGGVSAR